SLPFTFVVFVVSAFLKGLFVVPRLSYESTSSLKELFEARDFLSTFALTISESFLMVISWTLRFPMSSSRDSDVKSFDSLVAVTFALHLGCRALRNFLT
ncbi:hypothetical protein Tco_0229425, partial [Tanacetum coccineum]